MKWQIENLSYVYTHRETQREAAIFGGGAASHRFAILPRGRRRPAAGRLRDVSGAGILGPQLGARPSAAKLDAVLLTHAHVDHCGLVPKLVQEGFRGPIITTSASADLVELVLRDAAEIQAEDAAFKQKRHRKEGRQGKYPVKPLYTVKDVDRTLRCCRRRPTTRR